MGKEEDFEFWYINITFIILIGFDIWEIIYYWKYFDKLWLSIIATCCFGICILALLAFIIISTSNKIEEHKMKEL